MATYLELQQQAQKLLAEAEVQRKKEMASALDGISKTMAEYEISLEELFDHLKGAGFKAASKAKSAKPAAKAAPKYRNPSTGETWTGRGRSPAWIKEAEEKGKSRDKFLIK